MLAEIIIASAFVAGVLVHAALVQSTCSYAPLHELAHRWRAERTPPCSTCAHCRAVGPKMRCACPAYVDWRERTACERVEDAPAPDVRGTKQCRYERKVEP